MSSLSINQLQLIKAIRQGDNLTLEHLIRVEHVNPNFETKRGQSPIQFAASINSNTQTLQLLLDAGADLNKKGYHSPLEKFIAHKNFEAVRLLVKKGANVSCYLDEKNTTPLHASINYEAFDITKFLLESKAHVNARNGSGMTPLHNLVMKSSPPMNIIDMFIDAGADLNRGNFDGYTPLHTAVCEGQINNVVMLLERGADPLAVTADGDTALHLACSHGHLAMLQLLIKVGVPIESQNRMKLTPLHQAVDCEQTLTVFYLIKAGANVNALDVTGRRPIYSAALRKDVPCLNVLLKAGSRVSQELYNVINVKNGSNDKDDSDGINAVLEHLSSCPHSLKEMCLLTVRRILAPHLQILAHSDLPVSQPLRKEIALESLVVDDLSSYSLMLSL